jgi:carbon monoxide dehydrogenase subunit G
LSAEEEAQLRADEVVLRSLPTQGAAVRVLAVVDIAAPASAVWSTLMDFEWRKIANPAVQTVEPYRAATSTEQWVRWHVSKFGANVVYHNHYRMDRVAGKLIHELDTTQANDMVANRGVYEIAASPIAGHTRLAWDVESDFGRAIPAFVQSWMSTGATRDFMAELARRAEGLASR